MPPRPPHPDLDESVSLWPMEGRAVLARLLQDEADNRDRNRDGDQNGAVEDEDS